LRRWHPPSRRWRFPPPPPVCVGREWTFDALVTHWLSKRHLLLAVLATSLCCPLLVQLVLTVSSISLISSWRIWIISSLSCRLLSLTNPATLSQTSYL
jgi:hypothetical protein